MRQWQQYLEINNDNELQLPVKPTTTEQRKTLESVSYTEYSHQYETGIDGDLRLKTATSGDVAQIILRQLLWIQIQFYYSASALLAMQSAVLARGILSVCLSICPSVIPSRSGIVSRRMKIRSCGFQRLVGQSL